MQKAIPDVFQLTWFFWGKSLSRRQEQKLGSKNTLKKLSVDSVDSAESFP